MTLLRERERSALCACEENVKRANDMLLIMEERNKVYVCIDLYIQDIQIVVFGS